MSPTHICVAKIKRHGSVSRQVYAQREADRTSFTRRAVLTDRIEKYNYEFSITVNQINFLMGLLDSLGLICIIKVFLFFFCVPYEQRYFDVNFSI